MFLFDRAPDRIPPPAFLRDLAARARAERNRCPKNWAVDKEYGASEIGPSSVCTRCWGTRCWGTRYRAKCASSNCGNRTINLDGRSGSPATGDALP